MMAKARFSVFQSTRPEWGETAEECVELAQAALFQSTRPEWGETCSCRLFGPIKVFQSTRPEWGETFLR